LGIDSFFGTTELFEEFLNYLGILIPDIYFLELYFNAIGF
jgi:hypothetical protein